MAIKVIRPLSIICLIFLLSCQNESPEREKTVDSSKSGLPAHFQYERVNNDLVYAYHREGTYTQAEGYLRNGEKDGYWLSFYNNLNKIERIEHYIDGQLHGPFREYSLNGRLTLETFYENGELDGPHTVYKFGKVLEQSYYKDGKLDGEKRIYFDERNLMGVLQQKITYKDGVKHGKHLYYNDKGEVVLEYIYEDGVRIEEEGE